MVFGSAAAMAKGYAEKAGERGNGGTGDLVYSETEPGIMLPIVPGSVGERAGKIACVVTNKVSVFQTFESFGTLN